MPLPAVISITRLQEASEQTKANMDDTKNKEYNFEAKTLDTSETNKTFRNWLLTINNPDHHGFSIEIIKEKLSNLNLKYWCLAYEQGQQLHVHIFMQYVNNTRFATIKKIFPPANIKKCDGLAYQIRNYVIKGGKYKGSEKEETRIEGSFEEYGEIPIEPKNNTSREDNYQKILSLIDEGHSVEEIIRIVPSAALKINQLSKLREEFITNKNKRNYRLNLKTYYLFGQPGVGKTRYVYDHYDPSEICRITNYGEKSAGLRFDKYHGEKILCLDEYNSQIPITELNNYLDVYPNLQLPARYGDKLAQYEIVFIISNKPLDQQYTDIQKDYPLLFKALERRIHFIYEFVEPNKYRVLKETEGENNGKE